MKIQNTLMDLNNHLFEQLERLNDESLKGEELIEEVGRAKAIKDISQQIVSNANIMLEAQRFVADTEGRSKVHLPTMLGAGDGK